MAEEAAVEIDVVALRAQMDAGDCDAFMALLAKLHPLAAVESFTLEGERIVIEGEEQLLQLSAALEADDGKPVSLSFIDSAVAEQDAALVAAVTVLMTYEGPDLALAPPEALTAAVETAEAVLAPPVLAELAGGAAELLLTALLACLQLGSPSAPDGMAAALSTLAALAGGEQGRTLAPSLFPALAPMLNRGILAAFPALKEDAMTIMAAAASSFAEQRSAGMPDDGAAELSSTLSGMLAACGSAAIASGAADSFHAACEAPLLSLLSAEMPSSDGDAQWSRAWAALFNVAIQSFEANGKPRASAAALLPLAEAALPLAVPDVQRSAAYAIGVIATAAPDSVRERVDVLQPLLLSAAADDSSEEARFVGDNALSSLLRMAFALEWSGEQMMAAMRSVLPLLPRCTDMEEARFQLARSAEWLIEQSGEEVKEELATTVSRLLPAIEEMCGAEQAAPLRAAYAE